MKFSVIFIAFALMLAAAHAKGYSLDYANVYYEIGKDGIVHVNEKIAYNLYNCEKNKFKELYLQKPPQLQIINATGTCIGERCSFRIDEPEKSISGNRELILKLEGGGCGKITAVFDYYIKAIAMLKDGAQFYYKLWGDEWSKETKLTASILLPGNASESQYFVHYAYWGEPFVHEYGNRIAINAHQPANQMLEINLLMPKKWFSENGVFYNNAKYSKNDVLEIEEKTMRELEWKRMMLAASLIAGALLILFPIAFAIYIYLKYGRELSKADVGYEGLYEHEPPSSHAPAECIFFITGDENYGRNEKARAISAAVMTLVNKGVLDIESREKDVVLKFTGKKIVLKKYEEMLLNYLKKEGNGELSMEKFKREIAPKRRFYLFVNEWVEAVGSEIDEEKYVDYSGQSAFDKTMTGHLLLTLLFGLAGIMFSDALAILSFIALLVDGLLAAGIKRFGTIRLSKWTREGRALNLKWSNFKKYLGDFSALEEHPPESIKLWDEYMSYAVALGVAEKTIKAMKKIAPQWVEQARVGRFYGNVYFAAAFASSFAPSYTPKSSGVGGFGGGFGGGGGGAR